MVRSTTARTLVLSELIWLGKGEFLGLVRTHRTFAEKVFEQSGERLERTWQRYLLACHRGVRERLIWELLQLGRRHGRWQGSGLCIELDLRKHDLERLLGASHTAVTQARERIEKQDLLLIRRGAILLPDPLQLAKELGDPQEIAYWQGLARNVHK